MGEKGSINQESKTITPEEHESVLKENRELKEKLATLEKKIEELQKMVETEEVDRELNEDLELIKKTYERFIQKITEACKDEKAVDEIAFTEYLFYPDVFLKKLEDFLTVDTKRAPSWISKMKYSTVVNGAKERLTKIFEDAVRKTKNILLQLEMNDSKEKINTQECYAKFIKTIMRKFGFKKIDENVLQKATELFTSHEDFESLKKDFNQQFMELHILSATIDQEWGKGALLTVDKEQKNKDIKDLERFSFAFYTKSPSVITK